MPENLIPRVYTPWRRTGEVRVRTQWLTGRLVLQVQETRQRRRPWRGRRACYGAFDETPVEIETRWRDASLVDITTANAAAAGAARP